MKKQVFTSAALMATILPLCSVQTLAASNVADTDSQVSGIAKAGTMKIEGPDVDFGELTIGQPIPNGVSDGPVTVLDNSGGSGWVAEVKNTTYSENKDHLLVKFNKKDLTGDNHVFSKGKSRLDEYKFDLEASAVWGAAPKTGDYKSDVLWTLSPELEKEMFKWGTADYYFESPSHIVVENGTLESALTGLSEEVRDSLSVITLGEGVVFPVKSTELFSGFSNLERIEGFENVDMTEVTHLEQTFSNTKIDYLDLRDLDVSSPRLESTSEIFKNLVTKELDISGWEFFSGENNMNYGFKGIQADKVNMDGLRTYGLISTFYGVDFAEVDMDLSKMEFKSMYLMNTFEKASNLQFANINNWDVSSSQSFEGLFKNTKASPGLDLSNWVISEAVMKDMFNGSEMDLKAIGVEKITFLQELESYSGMFDNTSYSGELNLNNMTPNPFSPFSLFRNSSISSLDVSQWRFVPIMESEEEIIENIFYQYEGDRGDISNWFSE